MSALLCVGYPLEVVVYVVIATHTVDSAFTLLAVLNVIVFLYTMHYHINKKIALAANRVWT